jgi:hypothetical protein
MGPPYIRAFAVPTNRPVPMTPPILDGGEKSEEEIRKVNTPDHGDVAILEFALEGAARGPLTRLSIIMV